jgi:hypothetical protein
MAALVYNSLAILLANEITIIHISTGSRLILFTPVARARCRIAISNIALLLAPVTAVFTKVRFAAPVASFIAFMALRVSAFT